MALIGNPIVSTDFPVDYKSGNGSTTAFTLSVAPASVNSIDVQISGVSQSPQTYSVSGSTLTFSAAPPTGTNNIVVRHLGIAGIPNVPAVGSVTPALLSTANAVYWDGSGNVGIGTSSPSSQFSTANKLVIGNNSTNTGMTIAGGASNQSSIFFSKGTGSSAQQAAGYIYYLNTSDYMAFGTVNTERMRIDSSGRVTTPYQPHISGTPGLGTVGANGVADRFFVRTSNGLSFSSSRVTVPVAGAYLITFQSICNSSTGRIDTDLYVNGTSINTALSEDNGTGYHQRTHSIVLTLAANDYIQFRNSSWYATGNEYDNFQNASVTLLG